LHQQRVDTLQQALAMDEKLYGAVHSITALTLTNLAIAKGAMGAHQVCHFALLVSQFDVLTNGANVHRKRSSCSFEH